MILKCYTQKRMNKHDVKKKKQKKNITTDEKKKRVALRNNYIKLEYHLLRKQVLVVDEPNSIKINLY